MEKIATILNVDNHYTTEKQLIKDAITKEFYHSGFYDNNSQSANALAIAYDLSTDINVVDNLVKAVKENDYHLTVGEIALKPLFDVLCDYGYSDIAYNVLINTYGSFVDTHTTLPENWNGKSSQNHAMLGAGDAFFFEHLAGIQNAGVAFDKVMLSPTFPNDINNFNVNFKTKNGNISVKWQRQNDKIILNCTHDKRILVEYKNQKNIIYRERYINND
jgi:alpha-L-rhamnosidase